MDTTTTASPEAPDGGRRLLWAGVLLAILFGVFWDAYPLPDARDRLNRVPKTGSNFAGSDIPLGIKERVVLGKVALIHRFYEWNGREFFLTVIDGTKDRHAVHDPGSCFEGIGWRMDGEKRIALPGGDATCFQMTRAGRKAAAVFWFSDDEGRYSSLPRYWWRRTLRRLTLGRSGTEPLMVVLQTYGDNQPDMAVLAKQVIGSLRL